MKQYKIRKSASVDEMPIADQTKPNLLSFANIVTECIEQFDKHFAAHVSSAEFRQRWEQERGFPNVQAETTISGVKVAAVTAIQRNTDLMLSELRSSLRLARTYRDKLVAVGSLRYKLLESIPDLREAVDSLDIGIAQTGAINQINHLASMLKVASSQPEIIAEAEMACAYLERSIERVIQASSDANFAIRHAEEKFISSIENLPSERDDLDEMIPF
ncbi:MAG: hypothetical protein COA69_08595 [Robiginitomaculum sp.]|nr:MAG: hypothetical protein COA69_08595 [Robiginitomaculum sp.]